MTPHPQLAWRLAVRDSTLRPTARHVALTLDTWMDKNGHCFPERPTIADATGLGLRTVDAALRTLEHEGFLRVQRSRGRHVNHYYATLPNSAAAAPLNSAGAAPFEQPNSAANDTQTAQQLHVNSAAAAPEAVKKAVKEPVTEPATARNGHHTTPNIHELLARLQR
jgi:DNA-binding GntR family transcriptional regulator